MSSVDTTPRRSPAESSSAVCVRRTGALARATLVAAVLLLLLTACQSPFATHYASLTDVAMTSSTDGWALGEGAIYHFTGGKWTAIAQPPNLLGARLAMVSADEGWAVGQTQSGTSQTISSSTSQNVILHESGGQWTIHETLPTATLPSGVLFGLTMTPQDEGWAVGGGPGGALVLHLQGQTWSVDPLGGAAPASANLEAAAVSPDGTVWVVGDGGLILRRDVAGHWTQMPSPATLDLHAVSMVSADEGWAVGGTLGLYDKGVVLHYTNGTWTAVANVPTDGLWSLSMVSATEGWGGSIDGSFLHLHDGTVTKVSSPTDHPIYGISMVSPTEGWAVCRRTLQDNAGVFLHYTNGAWSQYSG